MTDERYVVNYSITHCGWCVWDTRQGNGTYMKLVAGPYKDKYQADIRAKHKNQFRSGT